jgi:hypothetical protein
MTDALDRLLRELHLPTVLAHAQAVAIEAERSGWSFTRYLYTRHWFSTVIALTD